MRIGNSPSNYNSYPSAIPDPAQPGLLSEFPIGGVEIDQSPCRSAYGLITNAEARDQRASQISADYMEALQSIVDEGTRMARIEAHGNPIADIAKENSFGKQVELQWGWIPNPIFRYSERPRNLYQAVSLGNSVDVSA